MKITIEIYALSDNDAAAVEDVLIPRLLRFLKRTFLHPIKYMVEVT